MRYKPAFLWLLCIKFEETYRIGSVFLPEQTLLKSFPLHLATMLILNIKARVSVPTNATTSCLRMPNFAAILWCWEMKRNSACFFLSSQTRKYKCCRTRCNNVVSASIACSLVIPVGTGTKKTHNIRPLIGCFESEVRRLFWVGSSSFSSYG